MKIKKIIPDNIKLLLKKFLFLKDIIKYFFLKHTVDKMLDEKNIKFVNNNELIELIINNKISLSRYGDGEFGCMLEKQKDIYFQKSSVKLREKLLKAFNSNNKNLYIGIPGIFNKNNLNKYKFSSRVYWYKFMNENFKEISQLIDCKKIYADSLITRCYIDLNKEHKKNNNFVELKKIWNDKEVVIIEGSKTKMGIGNDLFSNAKKIERIICPAKNAFDSYDKIIQAAKRFCKNKITIIALGPTASVLSYDLSMLNKEDIIYQALDLGHLDIEYEWFLNNCKNKTAIKGKFVNEVRNVDLSNCNFNSDIQNEYESQIIYRIE